MKTVITRVLLGSVAFFVACGITAVASAQTMRIRVVTYNIMDDINGFSTPLAGLITPFSGTGTFTTSSSGTVTDGGVLEGIGEEILAGINQPLDILALQETTSNGTTVQPIVNGLNAFYSNRTVNVFYAQSPVQGSQSGTSAFGNGPNALVYNTNTVQLYASVGVGTPTGSGNGEYRQVMRYLFGPAGVATNANNTFYIYVSHYKSGTTSTDLADRSKEAGIIRTNSASLPSNARVLYVGDYNISSSTELSYQAIVSTNLIGIQGIDPFNPTGSLGLNYTLNFLNNQKTDSCRSLNFRDDFQCMSSNVYNGVAGGLAYVSGTYHTFGNNGSSPYQGAITSGNTALNTNLQVNPPISAAQCYTNLYGGSDHLPVVADFTIPVPGSPPVALFSGSPTNGTAPLAVTFTDTSTGTISNRFWDFGDTTTTNITTNSVAHTYAAGTYTAMLVVSGSAGSSTNTQTNYITATVPPPPVASFSGSPTNGTEPLLVTFSDTSTGNITNRFWDFGDSGTTNVTTNSVTHTYAAGTYPVILVVSGLGGANSVTQSNYIVVLPPPPVASFTGNPTSGMEPLSVTFTDTSTGTITNRFWDFGDSGTTNVTTNSVTHIYAAGTYPVTLVVSGPGGTDSDTQSNYITALTTFQSWQVQYFGSTTNLAAASDADPDGDGCNNLCEFLSGTDPTNSASSLQITAVTKQGNDVLVAWSTAGGRTNVLQVNEGDVGGSYTTNFTDLSPLIITDPGTGDFTTNYLDAGGATNMPSRYYRVRLQP